MKSLFVISLFTFAWTSLLTLQRLTWQSYIIISTRLEFWKKTYIHIKMCLCVYMLYVDIKTNYTIIFACDHHFSGTVCVIIGTWYQRALICIFSCLFINFTQNIDFNIFSPSILYFVNFSSFMISFSRQFLRLFDTVRQVCERLDVWTWK